MLNFFITLVFVLPYCFAFWWKFILATPIIIFLSYLENGRQFLQKLGLIIPLRHLFLSIILFLGIYYFSHLYINYQISKNTLSFYPNPPIWTMTVFFQVFNEELVTRALLLNFLQKKLKSRLICAIFAALSFSLLHFLLYFPLSKIILNTQALLAIFLFGFLCNMLFLRFHHIYFGLALHLGWNMVRFSGVYFQNNQIIPEGILFNLFEGNWMVNVFLIGIILIAIFFKLSD
jgi:membrane protease YdiL (CAAX protease family)